MGAQAELRILVEGEEKVKGDPQLLVERPEAAKNSRDALGEVERFG